MKRIILTAGAAAVCFFLLGILQGCIKDSYESTQTFTYYQPVYKTAAEVRANIKSNTPQPIQRPGKIYKYGQYIFLNELDKGIHVINNKNPSQPQRVAFIDIPGNMDIAVKNNILYADLYTDLIALDISNPEQIVLKKVIENVFPHRYWNSFVADTTMIIASWVQKDTVVKSKGDFQNWLNRNVTIFFESTQLWNAFSNKASAAPYGVGGSMARFTITNDRLYTVGHSDLDVFNITDPVDPQHSSRKNVGWNIETIYPFMGNLFIGSQSGMYIYSISNPDNPVQTGQFNHVRSCDPVIADDKYAYVTLRSGTFCQGFTNELDILQLNGLNDPTLLKVYNLTNPHGLSKDGSVLFVCDGQDGLKIYNAADVMNLTMIKQLENLDAYDVITVQGNALVVAKDGLYQFDYSNLANIRLLSKMDISK